ncbi:hypothetical protein [Flavihumibacter petaseus]|uniref:hypothetical protein n=1 Tax=Flavihumibacter petaseus TaxID=549295 RepID=UPI00061D3AC5|nr:hypothetical protein [Flavihumibacter petaseus]
MMQLLIILNILASVATTPPDIYITWKSERIPCKFREASPYSVKIMTGNGEQLGEKIKFKPRDIQGFRVNGNVFLSKRIVSDDDSTWIFLPFRKPVFNFDYSREGFGDPGEDKYVVTGWSNGITTYYKIITTTKTMHSSGVNGAPMYTSKVTSYRIFLDNDEKGLSELPTSGKIGNKKKNERAAAILSQYFSDNPALVEMINQENRKATWENIEDLIAAYFHESKKLGEAPKVDQIPK